MVEMSKLQPVEVVLSKNKKLIKISSIGRLACKLAQHSIFGEDVLKKSTPMGRGELPPLPKEDLDHLKKILRDIFPIFKTSLTNSGIIMEGLHSVFAAPVQRTKI